MCAPDMPEPPDPKDTSAAQTGTNIGTAMANNAMTLTNQVTPTGSLSYDQSGTYDFTDPFTGKTYDIPTYTATTSLSPGEQNILDANTGARTNLAQTAEERSGFLKDYLPNATPEAVERKLYEYGSQRLDPRFAREEDQLRTRLTQQGLTQGSEAWNAEMERLGQNKNDAYNSLMLQGRGTALSEINNPINQITALLSGSQVSSPGTQMQTPQGAATTDVAGLINANYGQRLNNAQAEAEARNNLFGGLFKMATAPINPTSLLGGFM